MENVKQKYKIMFGFQKSDDEHVGYLQITDSVGRYGIYEVVYNEWEATKFPVFNIERKKGFASPERWAEFFNSEDELVDWKFHTIPYVPDDE